MYPKSTNEALLMQCDKSAMMAIFHSLTKEIEHESSFIFAMRSCWQMPELRSALQNKNSNPKKIYAAWLGSAFSKANASADTFVLIWGQDHRAHFPHWSDETSEMCIKHPTVSLMERVSPCYFDFRSDFRMLLSETQKTVIYSIGGAASICWLP